MTGANDAAYDYQNNHGLTKRELFAAMAMQGLLVDENMDVQGAVHHAVIAADSLIYELNKNPDSRDDG